MADKEELNPNKRERRLARKLLVEEEAAKAEEMLKQENASMLPRKRKRTAQNAINLAAQEEERLERERIVEQAKQDLKEPEKLSRKQRRAAEKVIAQAAEEKKLLRIKKREEKEIAEQERIRIEQIQADNTAKEDEIGSPQHVMKIKRERRMIEAELEKNERNYELRWEEFRKDSLEATERAVQRLGVLENAIARHDKDDSTRLQRLKLWKKKAVASGEKLVEQNLAKEESFEKVGITESTDTTFLDKLLEQQRMLIEFERAYKNTRATKRSRSEVEGEDPVSNLDSAKVLSMKLNSDLQQASTVTTSADMWATPFKTSVVKPATAAGELGATSFGAGYQGPRQPMKLEALSIYKQGDKLDPVQWFKAAKVKLKNQSSLGLMYTEEGAIAAIMDRTEVGSTIATWYQTQSNPEVLSSMTIFEAAFTRRFASGRTVEAALDRLSNIKSTSFADLDLFYTEFCDLISIIGPQRSKSDLVRNFLDAIPQSMRLLILVKNPGVRTSASIPIDELFLLAKEIAAAEKLVGGAKNAVMVVNQDTGDRNPNSDTWGVFPVNVNKQFEGKPSACYNCGSSGHLSRECDKHKRCYKCNLFGHTQYNCPTITRPPFSNFNRGGEYRGSERPNFWEDNARPNNTLSNNTRRIGHIPLRGQPPGGQGVNINMVGADAGGGDLRVPIGGTKDGTVINVVETTGDISDEHQVAFSDRGFDLLTTIRTTAKDNTDNTVPNPPGAPMNTGNHIGHRLRIIEIVQIELPKTCNTEGRSIIKVEALIDTGADVSCMSLGLANDLGIEPLTGAANVRITGAGGITAAVTLPGLMIHVRNYTLRVNFLMLPLGATKIILGLDVLSALGATITCSPSGVDFNPKDYREQLSNTSRENVKGSDQVWLASNEHPSEETRAVGPIAHHEDPTAGWSDRTIPHLGVPEGLYYSDSENFSYATGNEPDYTEEEFRAKLLVDFAWFKDYGIEYEAATALLLEFRGVFARNVDVSRPIKCPPMVINTTTEAPQGVRRPDRFTPEQRNFLDKELPRLLRLKILRASTSLWNSPLMLKEKAGPIQWRICNDYRALNEVTRPLPSVVPLIGDVLDAISEGKVFSKMDMVQGFLQLKLAEESMHKTAFSCYKGVFEYCVGALGMTNVPAYFLFAVSNVFADLREIVNTFFDDFIGHTKGRNQKEALGDHIADTRIILQRCKDNNIFLNFVKSTFFQPNIEVLGYRVSENKQMLPLALSGKLDALLPPKSSKDIQCFLGLVGFYRTYVKDFAKIAAPLIAAQFTKPFVWTSECQSAFIKLRSIASEEPYLRAPVRQGHVNYIPLVVTTDASDLAIGAVLSQKAWSGGEIGLGVIMDHPCGYLSKMLSAAQQNYSTFDRELLAIMFALQKWRQLLVASIFTIITDHLPLVYIMKTKFLTGRIARQVVELMNFNFKIEHRPGKENTNADALSRLTFLPEEASLVVAMILGNEVEFTEDYFGQPGSEHGQEVQLTNLWCMALLDVDPATLPENRPVQALRCTNNSVLMITRQHLNIQDQGVPGNRLGKTTKSSSEVTMSTQLAGPHPVVANTEEKTPKVVSVVGAKGACHMSEESTLRSAVGNKGAGYMLDESRPRSTVGNKGVEYKPEGSMLRSAVGNNDAGYMLEEGSTLRSAVGNNGAGYMLDESRPRSTVGNKGVEYRPESSMLRSAVGNNGAGYMLEEGSTLRSAVGNNGAGYMLDESMLRPAVGNNGTGYMLEESMLRPTVGNKGVGYMLEESMLRPAVGNNGAGYMREKTALGPIVGNGTGGIVWERTSLGPNVGSGAEGILTQSMKPVVRDSGFSAVKKKVTFGDPHTISREPIVPAVTLTSTAVGPEVPVGKTDKYHEEIWLSGALKILKGETPNASGKWLSKMTEQAKQYRGMFTELGFPIAIFTAPTQGLLIQEKALEVPAPGRRIAIVAAAHEFGHFGADKTMNRIRTLGFDWLGLLQDCEVVIKACRACSRSNAHTKLWAPAQSLPVPSAIFERIQMDLLMLPLVESVPGSSGDPKPKYNYLLLIVCALSKYPVAFSITSKESTVVAKALWNVICTFGVAQTITSDNGLEFCNQVVDALVNLHGISRRLTTAYRPQANGLTERTNRTVLSVLRKLTASNPQLWPEWVDFVMLTLRTVISRSTGFTPFQLMFGRDWNPLGNFEQLAIDFDSINVQEGVIEVVESALVKRVQLMRRHLSWIEDAKVSQEAQNLATRTQADKQHVVHEERIPVGSLVWKRNHTPLSKLDSKLLGPFRVSGEEGTTLLTTNYHLESLSGVIVSRSVPRDELVVLAPAVWISKRQKSLYDERDLTGVSSRFANVQPGPVDIVEGEALYAVEAILKSRVVKGRCELLVKWDGYESPSWVLEVDVPVEIRKKLWSLGSKFHC